MIEHRVQIQSLPHTASHSQDMCIRRSPWERGGCKWFSFCIWEEQSRLLLFGESSSSSSDIWYFPIPQKILSKISHASHPVIRTGWERKWVETGANFSLAKISKYFSLGESAAPRLEICFSLSLPGPLAVCVDCSDAYLLAVVVRVVDGRWWRGMRNISCLWNIGSLSRRDLLGRRNERIYSCQDRILFFSKTWALFHSHQSHESLPFINLSPPPPPNLFLVHRRGRRWEQSKLMAELGNKLWKYLRTIIERNLISKSI